LSGGIDSVSVMSLLSDARAEIFPLFCDYGQASRENEHAAADHFVNLFRTAPLKVVSLELWNRENYALLNGGRSEATSAHFFLPFRNLALAATGAAYAAEIDANVIAFGFNADGRYADGNAEFADVVDSVLRLSVMEPITVKLWRDAMRLSKADLIEAALRANVPVEATYSCYRSERCGECPSCVAVSDAFLSLESRFDSAEIAAHNPNADLVSMRHEHA
jgi:7-cyano-7-deazaguanine synthase